MNEKKTFKQEVKEWWQENKKAIKAGITCGLIGVVYGMFVGHSGATSLFLHNGYGPTRDDHEVPCDELGLTEENCDDPEFLEIVRFENENS